MTLVETQAKPGAALQTQLGVISGVRDPLAPLALPLRRAQTVRDGASNHNTGLGHSKS